MQYITQPLRGEFEVAREMAFGAITSSFTMIGTPFASNFSIVWIQNYTDVFIDFSISFDGLTKRFSLNPGGKLTADMISNNIQISAGEAAWCQYRTSPPSTGFVQIAALTPV